MGEVRTSSNYGIPIVIDQCKDCGGLWFDEEELYRTRHGVAFEIDKELNTENLRRFSYMQEKIMVCPKDGSVLNDIKESCFPENIKVKLCRKCWGFWFNYGEFGKYQEYRINKLKIVDKRKETEEERLACEKMDKKIVGLVKLFGSLEREKSYEKEKNQAMNFFYVLWMLFRILVARK